MTIKSIKVNGIECKICRYAADTTQVLDGSEASLQANLNALEKFSNLSGLKMNSKKPEAFMVWKRESENRDTISRTTTKMGKKCG